MFCRSDVELFRHYIKLSLAAFFNLTEFRRLHPFGRAVRQA